MKSATKKGLGPGRNETAATSAEAGRLVRGKSIITNRAEIIRATVGPGIIIVLILKNRVGGGAVFINTNNSEIGAESEKIVAETEKFLAAAEKKIGDLTEARAYLYGLSDILATIGPERMKAQVEQYRSLVCEIIADAGIKISRRELGGSRGRSIKIDFGESKIEMRLLEGAVKKSPPISSLLLPVKNSKSGEMVEVITVNMGYMHVDRPPVRLTAILGTCVGIALFDPLAQIGGLAHVMAPTSRKTGPRSKFADTAVEALIEEMEKAGAERGNLNGYLVGGADVVAVEAEKDIYGFAKKNIENARAKMIEAGVEILSEDVGGVIGRRMWLDLADFSLKVKMLSGSAERRKNGRR